MPWSRAMRGLIVLPMATPPFLMAIGWIMLVSPRTGILNQALMGEFGLQSAPFNIYSLTGMIFVEGLSLVPSAFLILSPAMRNIDPGLEESALVAGADTWGLLRRVVLPLLLPSILGASIYLFVVSCVVFDVPGTIGMPARIFVLSSEMYSLLTDSPRGRPVYGKVSAMALMFVLVLVVLAYFYQRVMRDSAQFRTISGKSFRPHSFRLGRYLSFGSRSINGVLLQMHPELEEAARVSGAGWGRSMRRVLLPLASPALASVWLWVFSHSLRELSAALTLQGADNPTLPTLLFGYWSGGQSTKSAAVAVWLVAGTFIVVLLWQAMQKNDKG